MVELFVWMAISALLGTVLITFALAANTGIAAMRSVSNVQLQAVQALRSVYNDMRDVSCICTNVSTGACVIAPTTAPSGTTLCLTIPATKNGWPSPKLVDTIQYDYIPPTSTDPGRLRRQIRHAHTISTDLCDRTTSTVFVASQLTNDPPNIFFTPSTFNAVTGGTVTVSINVDYGEWRVGNFVRTFPFHSAIGRAHNRNMNPASVFE